MRQLLLFAFLVSGLSMDLWGQEAVRRDVQTGSAQMEKVDLGLPSGQLWGSQNVGAASGILSDPGDVFAWGESTTKTYFEWATYSDTSDSGQTFTKYSNGAKTEIDPEDDAACQTLGEGWRVPSAGQWQELIDNCTFDYVVLDDGKYGYKVTGKNGNAIYLPVHESVVDDRYPMRAGFNVYYWTRDLDSQSDAKAQYIRFGVTSGSDISGNTWNDVNVSVLSVERMNPNVIRPVYVGGESEGGDSIVNGPSLIIWHKDGSKAFFLLSEQPKVVYRGETVTVTTSSLKAEYQFASIRKMTNDYEPDPEGIEDVKPLLKPFESDGESLVFCAGDKPLTAKVYSVNGTLVKSLSAGSGETASIPFGSLASGVYLVNVNGLTYKIHIR